MSKSYATLEQLLAKIEEPYRSKFHGALQIFAGEFRFARGSSRNHQAWEGGYIDHVCEVMNTAVVLYDTLDQIRPFPFSLSDALVVLFVHDFEKPWAYEEVEGAWRRKPGAKQNAHKIRMAKLAEAGITLSDELEQAVCFVEGEGSHYDNRTRGMSPLAAFCHMCDVASARIWYDYPKTDNDPWDGATRSSF